MTQPTSVAPWCAKVITLFPELFPGPLAASRVGKALQAGLWQLETINLRNFGHGIHRLVDDRPLGGGPGMVFRPDVVASALDSTVSDCQDDRNLWPLICLTPRGRPLHQNDVYQWSQARGVTLLCGRFEGIDERVIQKYRFDEVSLGDFVLSGGEIAAYALIDSVVRLIPDVLGNAESLKEESHSKSLLEWPQYTRPRVWQGLPVPGILLSGHHAEIAKWRELEAQRATQRRRPDLWQAYQADSEASTDK